MSFPRRSHCQNGHEFNEVNTYISPKSQKRSCRVCASARVRRVYESDLVNNRESNRLHMQRWRDANRERYRRQWNESRRIKKEWLDNQKTACVGCGESDPVCLDFHHTDATQKEANIAMVVSHWSLHRLQQEMKKCVVLCSNCHRKLHAVERANVKKES